MAGRAAKGGSPQVPKGSKQRKETEDQGKDPSVRRPLGALNRLPVLRYELPHRLKRLRPYHGRFDA
jgi:hypothetical protein